MAAYRNQPTYDFLGGEPPPTLPPPRESFRASQLIRADPTNEDLRAQIHKLQYDVESLKQEREATNIRHSEETRALHARADAEFARAQASESARITATARHEALSDELEQLQAQNAKDKRDTDRRLRTTHEENSHLQEEVDEIRAELSSQERQSKHELTELKAKHDELQQSSADIRLDRDDKLSVLKSTQQALSDREAEIGSLENEIMRLKTLAGDAETLAVIKETLQEQVAHITKLEATTQKQQTELRQYRKQQKAIELVEEEKRALEGKVRMMFDLRKELSEAQLQRQILEDERKSWTAYLENVSATDEQLKFDTPEELARAYIQDRSENATLLYELGKLRPEVSSKDATIQSLEEKVGGLNEEIEKLRTEIKPPADNKAQARLERQRTLAVKEVEYLRAQLKMYDAEEGEFEPEKHDPQKAQRAQELENLIDQYRKEIQTLHADLTKTEQTQDQQQESPQDTKPSVQPPSTNSLKRPHDSLPEREERLGELTRKNRTLQESLAKLTTANSVLEQELAAQKSQVASFKSSARTRVLELRSNPASDLAAVKQATLTNLRAENTALLARLEELNNGSATTSDENNEPLVPHATLTRLRADLDAKDATIASRDKHILRLKQIFSAKSLEFREAVASILGWKLDFMPNGRVRVTSMFYPGNDGSDDEDGDGEPGNYIVFDGEQGTMKVSGGPQSRFAGEIRSLIEFWVDGRREIPCFLAACTLEFWEKSTRAAKM